MPKLTTIHDHSNLFTLQEVLPLIHLLYRRNKNQHRSTLWFKWLSILRRNLTHLLSELSSCQETKATAREGHLVDHVLGKCYGAFRELAVEGRFCALGLVLVGVLARVVKGLGVRDFGGVEDSVRLEREGVEGGSGESRESGRLDLGERLERREGGSIEVDHLAADIPLETDGILQAGFGIEKEQPLSTESTAKSTDQVKNMEAVKRKKKRKNAIDDLFSNIM